MSIRRARVREMITEEAADWFVANREDLDEAQRRQFLSWLKESPVHIEEYLEVAQITNDLPAAASSSDFSLEALLERARTENDGQVVSPIEPRVVDSRRTRAAFRWGIPAAAAAMAVALIAVALFWTGATRLITRPDVPSVAHYATRHGEQLTRRLDDATTLHLNTDTAVTIRYSRAERRVDLEHGQALFEVKHDPARPFHVIAGSSEISDVGTSFEVYLRPNSTLITVLDGEVAVQSLRSPGKGGPTPVTAGQQLRIESGQGPARPTPSDTKSSSAWLQRRMAFKQEPLAVVAAEFNRYAATPIEIESPALQRLSISGVFRTDDPESFLAFLRTLDGVHVNITPTRIQVSGP
ncbi:MAG TPA: FecR domain-containing protein [Steroidobacteraceae bacterium]|jgi:transmembrane sensor